MILKESIKNKILNASIEIILIVIGILLALYIDNWNANVQYKKSIDKNFLRVYLEMEKNILDTKENIQGLYNKDSLIYLVMNDSVKSEDYFKNIRLAYLILYFHNLNLDLKAYQNLIQLNVSDDDYKEDLFTRLKELNALNEKIIENNIRMSSFVYEESLPLLAKNTKTFADLTFKGQINKDVVNYFMNSKEYKSYVSQYSIIAIKNQLMYYQIYLEEALKVYQAIGNEYKFNFKKSTVFDFPAANILGTFFNEQNKDTLKVKMLNDSLLIVRGNNKKMGLIRYDKNHYFTDNKNGGYFISLIDYGKSKRQYEIRISKLSYQKSYLKIK